MESPDQEIMDQIKLYEMQTVTEKLDGAPHLIPNFAGERKSVEFGNTGFIIHFGSGENVFDFMPEGKLDPDENNGPKYASMLCVSLLELHNLLINPEKLPELKMENSKAPEILAITNTKLIDAMKNLFSRSDVKTLLV